MKFEMSNIFRAWKQSSYIYKLQKGYPIDRLGLRALKLRTEIKSRNLKFQEGVCLSVSSMV